MDAYPTEPSRPQNTIFKRARIVSTKTQVRGRSGEEKKTSNLTFINLINFLTLGLNKPPSFTIYLVSQAQCEQRNGRNENRSSPHLGIILHLKQTPGKNPDPTGMGQATAFAFHVEQGEIGCV